MGSRHSRQYSSNKGDRAYLCSHYDSDHPDQETETTAGDAVFRVIYNRDKPATRFQDFWMEFTNCCRCFYIFCCPPCPPCIIRKIAFVPPSPTYDFVQHGRPSHGDYRIRLSQDAKDYTEYFYPLQVFPMLRGFYVENGSKKRRLACVFCRASWYGSASRRILLLSHSNAEDLGLMVGRITALCTKLSVDVFAYDYSGYGRSNGRSTEKTLYRDIERVYDFLIKRMKIDCNQIIAVGTSLGTAATIDLASRRRVCATILQGSFSSALRTMCPDREESLCIDQFCNVDKIGKVDAPTLFVHGEEDKTFGIEHALQLRAACPGAKNIDPLIIEGAEHVDFDRYESYWSRLDRFIHRELESPQDQTQAAPSGDTDPPQRSTSLTRRQSFGDDWYTTTRCSENSPSP